MTDKLRGVLDSAGKEIKLHDVLRNDENGEMAIVIQGVNAIRGKGLCVENVVAGIRDWLDVYPDGIWTVVGNLTVSSSGLSEGWSAQ